MQISSSINKHIKDLMNQLSEYGFWFTVLESIKSLLRKQGFVLYSKVKYPELKISVKVYSDVLIWKNIEKPWELRQRRFISKLITEGQIILDIGAYFGEYTLLFSKLVQAKGHVYAFDPDVVAFEKLYNNVKNNHATNITIERLCLSNCVRQIVLRAPNFGESISSIARWQEDSIPLMESIVNSTTIDNYCEQHGFVPHGIKIDVEGAERLVLEGAKTIFSNSHPWVLLEFHSEFMTEEEKNRTWKTIASLTKRILLLDGDNPNCQYGVELCSIPDCRVFHIFFKT